MMNNHNLVYKNTQSFEDQSYSDVFTEYLNDKIQEIVNIKKKFIKENDIFEKNKKNLNSSYEFDINKRKFSVLWNTLNKLNMDTCLSVDFFLYLKEPILSLLNINMTLSEVIHNINFHIDKEVQSGTSSYGDSLDLIDKKRSLHESREILSQIIHEEIKKIENYESNLSISNVNNYFNPKQINKINANHVKEFTTSIDNKNDLIKADICESLDDYFFQPVTNVVSTSPTEKNIQDKKKKNHRLKAYLPSNNILKVIGDFDYSPKSLEDKLVIYRLILAQLEYVMCLLMASSENISNDNKNLDSLHTTIKSLESDIKLQYKKLRYIKNKFNSGRIETTNLIKERDILRAQFLKMYPDLWKELMSKDRHRLPNEFTNDK